MASITRTRKNELTAAEIAAVQLSNRKEYGAYVTYDALSSNGRDKYIVTLRDGHATWCECPSTVPCKHRAAAEFEEAWSAPVAKTEQVWHDDDTTAHVEDDLASEEHEQLMADIAAEIIADELVRAEVAALPDADSSAMDEIDAMQAEKARKLAAQEAYREAWPEDFSFYAGAA